MARQKTGNKLADIRKATVAEIADRGSSAASVNAIAKRAGLAVGTLYCYFDNKDALLRSVFLSIKTEMHAAMMVAANRHVMPQAKIKGMWFALLEYARMHPQDFIFVEVVMNSALLSSDEKTKIAALTAEAGSVIEAAIAEGALRPGTTAAVSTLLIAPALQLGRHVALNDQKLDVAHAEEIFNLCWRAIAA